MSADLSVVVSGLPDNATLKKISEFCSKVGAIATYPSTGDDLILYNKKKHTATVTYAYPNGAKFAIETLNGAQFADGVPVTVVRAAQEPLDFSMFKKDMKEQRRYHSYCGDYEEELSIKEEKRLKMMVLRNVFTIKEMYKDPQLFSQIVKDWEQICSKYGKVKLIKPMEYHPQGIVLIRFDTPEAAARATGDLDGYIYHDKEISADPWDGTDLSCKEDPSMEDERFERFVKDINVTHPNEQP